MNIFQRWLLPSLLSISFFAVSYLYVHYRDSSAPLEVTFEEVTAPAVDERPVAAIPVKTARRPSSIKKAKGTVKSKTAIPWATVSPFAPAKK